MARERVIKETALLIMKHAGEVPDPIAAVRMCQHPEFLKGMEELNLRSADFRETAQNKYDFARDLRKEVTEQNTFVLRGAAVRVSGRRFSQELADQALDGLLSRRVVGGEAQEVQEQEDVEPKEDGGRKRTAHQEGDRGPVRSARQGSSEEYPPSSAVVVTDHHAHADSTRQI